MHFRFNNLDYDFEDWHKLATNEIALNEAKIKTEAHSDSTNIDLERIDFVFNDRTLTHLTHPNVFLSGRVSRTVTNLTKFINITLFDEATTPAPGIHQSSSPPHSLPRKRKRELH